MKFFPIKEPHKAKLKYKSKWKKRIVVFIASNIICAVIAPGVFDSVWGTVGNITGGVVEARTDYYARKKYGRTMAELRKTAQVWSQIPSAVNPANWGR